MSGDAKQRSPNWDERSAAIDTLVLHYTGMRSAREALQRLCEKDSHVSAHYFVRENGTSLRLVAEDKRAWHAGESFWRGDRNLNDRSLGIEIVNPGHENGYRAFPRAQIAAVSELAGDLLRRYAIPPSRLVAHSDIAADRKQDPGERFDWQFLAERGVGLVPKRVEPPRLESASECAQALHKALTRIGYDPQARLRTAAFQRRFRPGRIDNVPDAETLALARGYLTMLE